MLLVMKTHAPRDLEEPDLFSGLEPAWPVARWRRRAWRWRALWISDVHLGTPACRAQELLRFLATHECEHLYLVGDVIDGWSLRRSWAWNDDHNRVLRALLDRSARGTQVTLLSGNHDTFLADWAGLSFGGIAVEQEAVHRTADGRRLLVQHGDAFDACLRGTAWLMHLGDRAYAACRAANRGLDALRRAFGREPWSLADWLRDQVKGSVAYVERFERAALHEARRRGFDGIVCGHIHHAAVREGDGLTYANSGDWVGSCTALAEDAGGRLRLLRAPARRARPEALVATR